MTLRQRRSLFTFLMANLILFAQEKGYETTGGELFRSPEEAARLAKLNKGIKNSLHIKGLAIDLNLFKNGKFLSKLEDHKLLGDFWESLHENCRWGGRWEDGNHYEMTEKAWR